ncbi:MAG: signal peptidase I [Aristaeellaceae bacterium]
MVSTLLLTVMVALAVLLVGVRVVGLTPYTVLSGSMVPTYPVGAMIYVRAVAPQDIRVGTPLTFTLPGGTVATHRVHELVTVNGETQYITKGDANDTLDPPVSIDRVIGTPVFSIPLLGYLSAWLQTGAGTGSCIVLVAVLLLVQLLPKGSKSTQPSPGRSPSQTRSESCP